MTTSTAVRVPVTIGGTKGVLFGVLNVPPGATTCQVLVHGWTYNRYYFDPEYKPDTYSYARAANKAGYATLAIDRIGRGCSLAPLSLYNTFTAQVNAVRDACAALRDGSLGTSFEKIIAVGHSAGSITVTSMAGRYNNVDALITTGYTHRINAAYSFPTLIGRDYFAAGDPQFAAQRLDPLYVSSIPGTRYTFYNYEYTNPATGAYRLLNAEQGMVDYDEQSMRATDSLMTLVTALPTQLVNDTANLDVPVLAVNGANEPFFCGAGTCDCSSDATIADFEKQFYATGAYVEAFSVPGTGHDVHLEKTSPQATERMIAFCDAQVGAGTGAKDTDPAPPVTCPTPGPIDPPLTACLANRVLMTLVLPVVDAFARAVEPLPGMGDGYNPIPIVSDFLNQVVAIITDLINPNER